MHLRRALLVVVFALLSTATGVSSSAAAAPYDPPEWRDITFPVVGPVSYADDYHAPRSGGRAHHATDLMGTKLQPLVAAASGTIAWLRADDGGTGGNMLSIRDADGFQYRYIHINNDSPGTDDGLNPPEWAFGPGIVRGARVDAGQVVGYLGDSGNAEGTAPHLHFEILRPDGTPMNPWASLRLAQGLAAGNQCRKPVNPPRRPAAASTPGYHVLARDGGIFSFGDAPFHGSVPGLGLRSPVTALRLASTAGGGGYHVLGADGGVFSFGDARFFGSVPGLGLRGVDAIELRHTATGSGYWVLGADGGVFSFGDARFHGSVPGLGIRTRAIRLVPTPSGGGYWILGADGGVFSFGDARFFGSVPGVGVATQVVAMAPHPVSGYWVLAADGGVFAFGAPFHGSVPGVGLCRFPRGVQIIPSTTGRGYLVLGEDGSVWPFGDAVDHGDVPRAGVSTAGVDLALTRPAPGPPAR